MLLDRQSDDDISIGLSQQRDEVAAYPLLRRAQLQVLLHAHLAAELRRQTAQHRAAEGVIRGHSFAECLGADQKKMGLLIDTRPASDRVGRR